MIFRILKFSLVGLIWSYFYIYYSNILFLYIWKFDFLNLGSWLKISDYWNHGGAIKESKDFIFLFMLLALIPVWIIGWRKLYQVNYAKLLLLPYTLYNQHIINKYKDKPQHFVLKTGGTSLKAEEEIKLKQAAVKPNTEQEADKIRLAIQEKINKSRNKI